MKPNVLLLTSFFALTMLTTYANNMNIKCKPDFKKDISGVVIQGGTRKPLSNVNITAYVDLTIEKVAATDNSGNFSFFDLKPGTYRIVFEKNGYKKITKEKVVIRTDETFQMTIEMFEAEDFNFIPSTLNLVDFK